VVGHHEQEVIMAKTFDIAVVTQAWTSLVAQIGELGTIHSAEESARTVSLLDTLLAETRGQHRHPLESLVSLVGDLVESFENRAIPASAASPAEVLLLLMESNGLTQTDLAQELGGQPVVSAILNGRRRINARQASELASRFGVSPALFIATASPTPAEAPASARQATAAFRKLFRMDVVELTSGAIKKATTAGAFKRTRTKFERTPMKRNTSLATNEMILSLH
jgi:HTH-type transcriptional regulator / antitoxin HigA